MQLTSQLELNQRLAEQERGLSMVTFVLGVNHDGFVTLLGVLDRRRQGKLNLQSKFDNSEVSSG